VRYRRAGRGAVKRRGKGKRDLEWQERGVSEVLGPLALQVSFCLFFLSSPYPSALLSLFLVSVLLCSHLTHLPYSHAGS